jgi:mono/diheme cytochrome c family protein
MKFLVYSALALLLAGPALAHGTLAAHFGGQIQEIGDWRIEFVLRDGGVRVWVRDHDDKMVPASGKLTLLADGKKHDLTLKAEGEMLMAEAPVNSAAKAAAIVSLTVAGKPVSARFAQEALKIPALSKEAKSGEKIYAEVCVTCHGTALRGADAGPPLLHEFYALGGGHGDDLIVAAVLNGTKSHHWKFGDMPKPEDVKPGQEKELNAYIRAMQAANGFGAPPTSAPPAQAATGGHAGHH